MTKKLPAELDNDRVIFSYGSLLDHKKLRELFKKRGEFKILETSDAAEAALLSRDNPKDIIILSDVVLKNIRASIVTETILRRRYKTKGGDIEKLIDAEITTRETFQALYLYARPASANERGKTLNGGLICNLTKEEILTLDGYEFEPVLKRTRAPELKIGDRTFFPEHICFYAGEESSVTAEEKEERSRLLNQNRKPGEQSPQANWRKNVRRNR